MKHGARRARFWWRLLLVLSLAWALVGTVGYAIQLRDIPAAKLSGLFDFIQGFLLWQIVGFIVTNAVVSVFFRTRLGRIGAGYLALSAVALLGASRELPVPLTFAFFLLASLCVVNSARLSLQALTGLKPVGWGLAAGVTYAALIPLSFLLGILGLLNPWAVGGTVLVAAVPGCVDFWRLGGRHVAGLASRLDALGLIGSFSLEVMWIASALVFVCAMGPETDSDSIRVYLPAIEEAVHRGGFVTQFLDFHRMMVKGAVGIHAFAFAAGSYSAAKLVSVCSVAAIALLVGEEITRRSGSSEFGLLSAAVTITSPLLLRLARSLYHDQIITVLVVTSFVLLFRGMGERSRGAIVVSAFVMGGAVQTKYSVLLLGVLWWASVVAYSLRTHHATRAVRWCVLPTVALVVFSAPWYLYTWHETGSPVYPFFNEWFDSPHWPEGLGSLGRSAVAAPGFGSEKWHFVAFPWVSSFRSSLLIPGPNGTLGFQLLALCPFIPLMMAGVARSRWRKGGDLGLVGMAGLCSIGAYSFYARLWLPVYPLLLMSLLLFLGSALDRAAWKSSRLVTATGAMLILICLSTTLPFFAAYRFGVPWDLYTKQVSRSDWLAVRFPGYEAIEQFNELGLLGAAGRVVSSGFRAAYLFDGDSYHFPRWKVEVIGVKDLDSLAEVINTYGIEYWAVAYSDVESVWSSELGASYWTPERMVAAFSSVAVFDVAPEVGGRRLRVDSVTEIIPRSCVQVKRPSRSLDSGLWERVVADESKIPPESPNDGQHLRLSPPILYAFSVEDVELCGLEFELLRDSVGRLEREYARIVVEWFNSDWSQVGRVSGFVIAGPNRQFFSRVPGKARYGRITLSSRREGLLLKGTTVLRCGSYVCE